MILKISQELLPRFKNFCSSPEVIMLFVYMKCRFSLSYRELEEMMQIRGAVLHKRKSGHGSPILFNFYAAF